MVRPLIPVLLLLLLVAPASAQGGHYIDREQGFSLQIPEGWTGAKAPAADTLVRLHSPDRSAVYSVRLADSQGASAAQIEAALVEAAPGQGYKVLRRWRDQIAGQPASGLIYESKKGVEQTTILVTGTRAYMLQCAAADRKKFQAAAKSFATVTRSFQFELTENAYGSEVQRRQQEQREADRYERLREQRIRQERLDRERRDRR